MVTVTMEAEKERILLETKTVIITMTLFMRL